MIILDTNVLSEFIRARPEPRVTQWLSDQAPSRIYTTAVNLQECFYGAELLDQPAQSLLIGRLEVLFESVIGGRVLSFDEVSARYCAVLLSRRRRAGRPLEQADAQIASICARHGATLATRNVTDFIDTGVSIVNPWDARR